MSSARKPKTIDPDKVDPSVYYYDEVYDDMKQEQESERSRAKQSTSSARDRHKGSKYIDGLKETAELRKTEKEIRKFKKYARDREEAEADGDVSREDVYTSDSYRRKLAEIKQLEAEKSRRHEHEQDRSMNFVKKYSKTEKSDSISSSRRARSETTKTSPDGGHRTPTPEIGTARTENPEVGSTNAAAAATKRRPKTLDERRKYLREVLKKRTVGRVYDEAVQRYMQRKALSQR